MYFGKGVVIARMSGREDASADKELSIKRGQTRSRMTRCKHMQQEGN